MTKEKSDELVEALKREVSAAYRKVDTHKVNEQMWTEDEHM